MPDNLTSVYFSAADAFLCDRTSKGTEFGVLANPTRNRTLRTGYSYSDRRRSNAFHMSRTGRPSILNQLPFDRNQAFSTITVAQRIAQSDAELAAVQLEEQQAYGDRARTANIWTRCTFTFPPPRGFAIDVRRQKSYPTPTDRIRSSNSKF